MARQADGSKPRLSFEQANAICRNWIALGDQADSYFETMLDLGFEAFLPRKAYIESFAANESELVTHQRCVTETVKEQLGQPRYIPMSGDELKRIYFSPFLQSLRQQRDKENGCSERELTARFGPAEATWRREIDPCKRNLEKDRVTRRAKHESRFKTVVESQRQLSAEEADRYSTGRGRQGHMFDEKDRYASFVDVMLSDAALLGFELDKARSRAKRPFFSKTITDDWHLCWSTDDRFFLFTQTEGRLLPSLHLCSRKVRNPREVTQPFQTLLIRYDSVVAEFPTGYWVFHDFDQLERAIKAHLQLYGLVAATIEGGIKRILGDLPA
jgi:hypothetical protein